MISSGDSLAKKTEMKIIMPRKVKSRLAPKIMKVFESKEADELPFETIFDAVGGKIEIICDGGIRRGTDVLKALSLGANACSMGRPYLYGLASAGQLGVEAVLSNFESEIKRNLMLMGVNNLSQLNRSNIRKK